jgi:hypothetical protein
MKRFKLVRYIGPNEVIPAFYGVAWHDWASFRYAVAPMPLASLFGMARWIRACLLTATKTMAQDPRIAYLDGVEHGFMLARQTPYGQSAVVRVAGKARMIFDQHCK